MKANLKNALMIVAALLVVYVVAFFVTMEVKMFESFRDIRTGLIRIRVPRWGEYSAADPLNSPWIPLPKWDENSGGHPLNRHWTVTFFAPLIWVEHHVRPPEYWEWKAGQPKPDWMK